MIVADRLRNIREMKKLSQGEVAKRSGLYRSYVSRVENGHTVPTIATLEKMARAFEIPLYQLFYEGEKPLERSVVRRGATHKKAERGRSGKEVRFLRELQRHLGKMTERDRQILLRFAATVSRLRRKGR
jgi:transcriptional regulator with XRE-family HTH domain